MPIQTLKVGSLGTHNALGLAKAKNARFLLASTSEVYGDPLVHPQREDYWGNVNPVGPRGVYDEAKRFSEAMTMAYHRVHGVETRIVRIFNTYGPRMRVEDGRAIPAFLSQALRERGRDRVRRRQPDPQPLLRLRPRGGHLPPDDVERGEPGEHRQPHEMTIRQLAERIIALTGSKSRIVEKPAARGRSQGPPARHHPRAHAARLGAQGAARRGPREGPSPTSARSSGSRYPSGPWPCPASS